MVLLLACAEPSPEPVEASWHVVARDEPGALLSLADGPLVVGADAGHGPAAWRLEGSSWVELPLDEEGDVWWASTDRDGAWLVGSEGRVIRVEEERVTRSVFGEDTLFGVDGSWVVGDSGLWTLGGEHLDPTPLFKVWSDGDEAFAVGPGGVVLRHDGVEWTAEESGTDQLLVSVTGAEGRVVAVGGDAQGLVLERISGGWVDLSPEGAPPLAGVALDGETLVVAGRSGSVRIHDGSGWSFLGGAAPTVLDLHDVRIDGSGIWVVGGNLSEDPMSHGVVALYGPAEVPLLDDERSRVVVEEEGSSATSVRSAAASCEDEVHLVEVEIGGRHDRVDLYLYGPADLVERHTLVAVEWHPQYVWTRLEATITDSHASCSATPITWLVDLDEGCAVFGDEPEGHEDCAAL